jgi:class 3 adenylate cyclase
MLTEGYKRKLAAILSADAEGYSRLMGDDEEATVRTITAYREVISTLIQQHNGIVLDSPGDNLLAEFTSVVDAVQCAVAVQKEIKVRNSELTKTGECRFGSASTSVMSFRTRSGFMGTGSTSPPGWKGWRIRAVSASPGLLLIKSKASCRTDTNFWGINR